MKNQVLYNGIRDDNDLCNFKNKTNKLKRLCYESLASETTWSNITLTIRLVILTLTTRLVILMMKKNDNIFFLLSSYIIFFFIKIGKNVKLFFP